MAEDDKRSFTKPINREIPGITQMKQRGLKVRTEVTSIKIDKYLIHKKSEN